jgi:hypothetical protein
MAHKSSRKTFLCAPSSCETISMPECFNVAFHVADDEHYGAFWYESEIPIRRIHKLHQCLWLQRKLVMEHQKKIKEFVDGFSMNSKLVEKSFR